MAIAQRPRAHFRSVAPRFIHVNPESRRAIFWSVTEPTPEDLQYARVSLRLIIRLRDLRYYGITGKWLPITRGVLARAQIDDDIFAPPVHVHPIDDRIAKAPARRRRQPRDSNPPKAA